MLNELQQLRRSLQVNGIQTAAWHPSIKPLAKYPTLLVRLDDQGSPASAMMVPPENAALLRNIQPDNQKSFPAFNLDCPIFLPPEDLDVRSFEDVLEPGATLSLRLAYDMERLTRILHEYPKRIAPQFLAASADPSLASTLHLLEFLTSGKTDAEQFVRSLAKTLICAEQQGSLRNEFVLEFFFGKLTKAGTREPWKCLIYLDLDDLSSYQTAVASPEAAVAWSSALLADNKPIPNAVVVQCALDGDRGQFIGDKMPNPNLPLLGGTYLFSMNAEIPCQKRYGQSSTSLFPVTRRAIQSVNDALLHVTAKEMEGKTWSSVPSGFSDKPDLLIAYIEEAPYLDVPIAGTFGFADESENKDDDEIKEISSSAQMSMFVQRLSRVIEVVRLLEGRQVRATRHLRVSVFSTIDKGRKQVLFDERYALDNLESARDRWITGAQNVPPLDVRLFEGKNKTRKHRSGVVPSPVSVARSFRALWIRQGERSETVSGVSLGRIYKLLLEAGEQCDAAWLFERFLPLKVDLLIAAGKPSRDKTKKVTYTYTGAALSGPASLDLLTTVATFGILLNLLGRTKETYMNERDYLLGQLLQFADRLHLAYCHGARGGQVPPQLIGNSLLNQAGQSPAKALAILQQRLPVYERYVTQLRNSPEPKYSADEKDKEKAYLAKLKHDSWRDAHWIKAMLAKFSAEVHRLGLEPTRGPQGQAELLLGYLAAPEKSKTDPTNVQGDKQ